MQQVSFIKEGKNSKVNKAMQEVVKIQYYVWIMLAGSSFSYIGQIQSLL
jgi:hypothetical protein